MENEKKFKQITNNDPDLVFRKIKKYKNDITITFFESLADGKSISKFIIKSILDTTEKINNIDDLSNIISNFKSKKIKDISECIFFLQNGFTIVYLSDNNEYLAFETKAKLSRDPSPSETESSVKGPKDSFVEDYQKNIGLIKKRIKSNDLKNEVMYVGKDTKTKISLMYINCDNTLIDEIKNRIKKIESFSVIDSNILKKYIDKEKKSIFPTIISTERPDMVAHSLLNNKPILVVDNSSYILVLKNNINDFIKIGEDLSQNNINTSITRILKYIALVIALLVPAIYISLITYNQEMIPTELLISFTTQRNGVPFPAFVEAIIMLMAFEILKESDLRVPSYTGSSLSIVGALILGDAAVNAGIVSPIMIIVIALTSISSLPFTEPDFINAIRYYRILFMIGGTTFGIIGVVIVFILFITKLSSIESFGEPYLSPFSPPNKRKLKDSIIKTSNKGDL